MLWTLAPAGARRASLMSMTLAVDGNRRVLPALHDEDDWLPQYYFVGVGRRPLALQWQRSLWTLAPAWRSMIVVGGIYVLVIFGLPFFFLKLKGVPLLFL